MDTIICRDIYIRHTDTNGGRAVRCHRVWDAQRFIDSQKREAAEANRRVQEAGDIDLRLAKVEQITEEQYQQER